MINKSKKYNNFSEVKQNFSEGFYGYNEIDFCIKMKKETNLLQYNNFKLVDKNENKDEIILKKDTTYFIEIKKSINKIYENMNEINQKNNRFIEAFKNVKITEGIDLNVNDFDFFYICNNNYYEVLNYKNNKKDKNKFIYSNPQIGINMLIKLRSTIKNLNQKINEHEEKLENYKEEIVNQKKN